MKGVFTSLSYKIGVLIIIIEALFLMSMGFLYVSRLSYEVDMRIQKQVQLPGLLMNAGLLDLDSVSDSVTMEKLLGHQMLEGMVIGVNGNIFYSHDPRAAGKNIREFPDIYTLLPDLLSPREIILRSRDKVKTLSPVFASDKETVRFFVYTVIDNLSATEEKRDLVFLFITGALISLVLTSVAIISLFSRLFSRRIISLARVFKQMASGDLTVRIEETDSTDEIGFLQQSFAEMIVARQLADAQIIHLNRILKAIRNVNQMITLERNEDHLLEGVCDFLIKIDSYESAWIMIMDEKGDPGKFFYKNRTGKNLSMKELSDHGGVLKCAGKILSRSGTLLIKKNSPVCRHCFLNTGGDKVSNTLGIRLEYEGNVYGILNIHVNTEYDIDSEEISLFEEVAGDISFALYNIDMSDKRIKAEQDLQISERRFMLAMEAASYGLYDWNLQTNEVYYSAGWKKILGYGPEELSDDFSVWKTLTRAEDVEKTMVLIKELIDRKRDRFSTEFQMRHKDGHYVDILSKGRAVFNDSGVAVRIIGTHQDISSQKLYENQIKKDLEERNALLRELYHRTKNNMQLIVSLLSMKMSGNQNKEMDDILSDVENKIQSMALVHQMLYQGKNLSQIDLKPYITDLFENLIYSSGFNSGGVSFVQNLESVLVSLDTAIPLGMIFSELISNTMKHGFKDYRSGEDFEKIISVSLFVSNTQIHIEYSDNGRGCELPENLDKIDSMGLQTIISLVESQLQGRIETHQNPGLTWHFILDDQQGNGRVKNVDL